MSLAVFFTEKTDLRGIGLTQTATKHVITPYFTMPQDKVVMYSGHQYQAMKAASVQAFSELLNIDSMDVVITEKIEHDGERWWRLGTRYPEHLPVPKITPKNLDDGPAAIDI